jgi:hypothetical protein
MRQSPRPWFGGTKMKYCRVGHVLGWIPELCWRKKEELPVAGKSHAIGFAVARTAGCLFRLLKGI